MERYKHSAKNLLCHFRHCLKGPVPFTLDWDKETTAKLGDIDSDAVKYVKYISATVRRRSKLTMSETNCDECLTNLSGQQWKSSERTLPESNRVSSKVTCSGFPSCSWVWRSSDSNAMTVLLGFDVYLSLNLTIKTVCVSVKHTAIVGRTEGGKIWGMVFRYMSGRELALFDVLVGVALNV
jgi:hypothetical protein